MFQQLHAEAVTDAHEEDVLTEVLDDGYIKRKRHKAASFHNCYDNRKQQAGNNRGRNGEFPQKRGVLYNCASQENDDSGEAQAAQVFKLEAADRPVHTRGVCAEVTDDVFHTHSLLLHILICFACDFFNINRISI